MLRIGPLVAGLALLPATLAGQDPHILQDARLPRSGEVWIELSPALLDWDERFAADGSRVPLAAGFDGPILSRFFPAPEQGILADLNSGAADLGFDPLQGEELSVGELAFGTVQAQVVRALASLRVGLLDRVALELGLPIVATRVEPFFAWDTAAATVARASVALPGAESFLAGLEGARASLQSRLEEGGLAPEEEAAALALLEDSGRFLDALRTRVLEDRFLPLAGTLAGLQMLARFGSLSDGFSSFEIGLPPFELRESPGVGDLQAFFTGPPGNGRLPGVSRQSFEAGEVEAGVLVGLLDNSADRESPVRLRTTVGAKLRIPLRNADAPPFADRTDPFRLPIGDGQRDLELALYQDLWLGSRWRLGAAGRVGIQAADELRVRVHPPERPFALADAEAAVRRDLGDYAQIRVAPQYLLNDVMAIGAEYGFWRKGADEFRLLQEVPGLSDARPLEVGSAETRHRLGFGVFYRPRGGAERGGEAAAGDAAPGDDPSGGGTRAGQAREDERLPWRIAVVVQWALAGSGGRTPASRLLTATLRVPFRAF